MRAQAPTRQAWLYGPVPDLVLGCGGGYVLLGLVFLLPGVGSNLASVALLGTSLAALLATAPHYGATILRVYERREERRRFALFAVHATIVVALLFVGGIYQRTLGSILITTYATWSMWHFGGQNYGLGLMFLRRRGIPVNPALKRLFYTTFITSVVLAELMLHRGTGQLSLAPVPGVAGDYRFLSLGIPPAFVDLAFPLVGIAYLGVLAAVLRLLWREASARELLPVLVLVLVHALWFATPAFIRFTGRDINALIFSGLAGAVTHAVQYLWVTAYYASNSERPVNFRRFYTKAVLVGAALFTLPALLFAPRFLGTVSYAAGFSIVLFSAVNIHHFILDGAIWKLRDGRVARVLLRAAPASAAAAAPALPAGNRSWLRPLAWSLGAVFLAIELVSVWEHEVGVRRALFAERVERAAVAAKRLAWIGRDDYTVYRDLADVEARRQLRRARERGIPAEQIDFSEARRSYQRSIEIHPTPDAWLGLGNTYRAVGDTANAWRAYRAALVLEPRHLRTHNRLGELWLDEGELASARRSLERALQLSPRDARTLQAMRRLRVAERAQAHARASGEH